MAYQSLYRRYRPSRFGQLRGQSHVIGALLNAVRNDSVTHAYLFSGPRGTGKTSTARILAKALNCENLQDGEPCGECQSCLDMEAGRSFDLFELDAASNNGVDAIRDLIERAAVGSPGRTKVYILDEVHMLSPAASNALLKTLEEPPEHVRFVLATTDPQKVLPTIKSRTQHFEFQLLSAEELEEYVRWIGDDADLDLDDNAIRWAVRQGKGSARDTLSALDQVVAAGGVVERAEPVEQLLEALADKSPGAAVIAIAESLNLGHDPRVLGRSFLDVLRDAFLISLDGPVPHLVDDDVERIRIWADRIGTPLLTRSMEAVGSALVDMRQAADPRVPLEVALVRLATSGSDSVAELVERIEKLEGALAQGVPAPTPEISTTERSAAERSTAERSAAAKGTASEATSGGLTGPARAKAELARQRAERESRGERVQTAERARTDKSPSQRSSGPAPVPPSPPVPPSVPSKSPPQSAPKSPPQSKESAARPAPDRPEGTSASAELSVDLLNDAMADAVLPSMKGVSKAIYSQGAFSALEGNEAVFTVENAPTRDRAERSREQVESLLSAHFARPVRIRVTDSPGGAGPQRPNGRTGGKSDSLGDEPDRPPPPTDDRGSGSGRPRRTPTEKADRIDTPIDGDEPTDPGDDDYLTIDVTELEDATDVARTGVERLLEAFPGATVVVSDTED